MSLLKNKTEVNADDEKSPALYENILSVSPDKNELTASIDKSARLGSQPPMAIGFEMHPK